jgi:HSP20 family molecular chaperone IbpA
MKKDFLEGFKLNDVLKGISDLVDLVQKMEAEKKTEENITGNFQLPRDKNFFQGSYGFSVKLGGLPDSPRCGQPRTIDAGRAAKEKKMPAAVWEPVMDIFDEGGTLQIVVEMPGATEDQVNIEISGSMLDIAMEKGGAGVIKSVPIPCPVKPESLRYTVRNGILKIILDKAA